MFKYLSVVPCYILLFALLLLCVRKGMTDSTANNTAQVTVTPPVVVASNITGTWNLNIQDTIFNARAVYTGAGNDIYITSYSLWPKKQVITNKYRILNIDKDVFDPQFSPDGTKVLFKVGWPFSSYSLYTMYLWNVKTNNVHKVRMPFTGSSLKDPSVLERPVDTFRNKGAKPFEYSFPIVKESPNGRYLSYIRGGNIFGEIVYGSHIFLDTFDLQNKVRHFLVRNDAIPYGYAWTSDNKILYSAIEDSTINIYRISPDGKDKKLVIKNAYRPVPSPDGSKIAFFGPEDFDKDIKLSNDTLNTWNARGLSLSVANWDGTQRKALNRENGYYPEAIWMPDGKHLVTVTPKMHTPRPTNIGAVTTLTTNIAMWDTETGKYRHVCDLPMGVYLPFMEPRFDSPQVSPDGKLLFIQGIDFIKAINLTNGDIEDIVTLKNAGDIQWQLVE